MNLEKIILTRLIQKSGKNVQFLEYISANYISILENFASTEDFLKIISSNSKTTDLESSINLVLDIIEKTKTEISQEVVADCMENLSLNGEKQELKNI